jgi:hypothetical protein
MIKSNNIIARDMLDILRECKGKRIEALHYVDDDMKSSIEIVVLRFHDYDIELWNLEQPDKEDGVSDLAKIFIKKNYNKDCSFPHEVRYINGIVRQKDLDKIHINRKVVGISVYNELVKSFDKNGTVDFLLANTYAIVISLGKRYLHLVKDIYWSEFWEISFSQSPVPKAPEWDESEGDKYEITHSVIEL